MCVVCVCCVSFASRVRFVRGRGIYRIKAKFLLEQMSLSFSIVDGIRRSIVYMREHNWNLKCMIHLCCREMIIDHHSNGGNEISGKELLWMTALFFCCWNPRILSIAADDTAKLYVCASVCVVWCLCFASVFRNAIPMRLPYAKIYRIWLLSRHQQHALYFHEW